MIEEYHNSSFLLHVPLLHQGACSAILEVCLYGASSIIALILVFLVIEFSLCSRNTSYWSTVPSQTFFSCLLTSCWLHFYKAFPVIWLKEVSPYETSFELEDRVDLPLSYLSDISDGLWLIVLYSIWTNKVEYIKE